ncbi:hypothetical protein GGX14DRAFT_483363, partial [Mycena pura]
EYPVTRKVSRTWSYFLVGFSALSFGGFAALNTFLVGYDVVTITTTNFNATHRSHDVELPWYSGTDSACEPHQFQLGDTFRTNISAFSYSIFDVQPPADDTQISAIQGGFFYRNNDLSSCDVVQYEILVQPGDRMITSTAVIQCPSPLNFQALTSWSFSNHLMMGAMTPSMFPENSLARALLDAMNSFSVEGYQDIYNGLYITNSSTLTQKVNKVIANGRPNCDDNPPFFCSIGEFDHYNAIGNIDLNIIDMSLIEADVRNLYNIIEILFAAVRLDLGHWVADNVFTNTTSFNDSIVSTDGITDTTAAFRSLAGSKGMAYVNSTIPPPASARTSTAVIEIPYTCNVRQRKPLASFAVSVLSATLSMFLGAWGVVMTVITRFERRRPGGNACNSGDSTGVSEDKEHANARPLLHKSTLSQPPYY